MSKYYKVDEVEKLMSCGCAYAIRDLPTIEVSEDAISREWVLNFFVEFPDDYTLTIGNLRAVLNDAPSVIPKPKEGEWIVDGRCSNCLQAPLTTHKTYCPNCGAKMRG